MAIYTKPRVFGLSLAILRLPSLRPLSVDGEILDAFLYSPTLACLQQALGSDTKPLLRTQRRRTILARTVGEDMPSPTS